MQIDLELYREEIFVSENPPVRLSVIDVAPEAPAGTLIMVHGYGGYGMQWKNQLQSFADRYRVIAYDLRGHHHSDAPYSRYDMAEFVGDLETLVSKLNVQLPFVLMGHSFGGAIATEYASRHPEQVSRLILIATTGEYRLAAPLPQALSLLPILRTVQRFARKSLRAKAHVLKHTYQRAMGPWNGWAMFEKLKMPVLVIRGHRDQVYPTAIFEKVAQSIPDAQDVNVGASSHLVMLERGDAVTRSIDRFLTEQLGKKWRDSVTIYSPELAAQRPWIKHYEKNVPATIGFPKRPLHRLLRSAARRYGGSPAIKFGGRVISYRELDSEVNRMANALRSLGVDKGTRVIMLMPNCAQFVIAYYAILRAGATVVSVGPVDDRQEIRREIEDSGAEVLITLTLFSKTVREVLNRPPLRAVIYANLKDYFSPLNNFLFSLKRENRELHELTDPIQNSEYGWGALIRNHPPTPPKVDTKPDDIAVIQYTSGTTDKPKGVMLTHFALLANTLQTRHWISDVREGRESVLCVIPFSHIYGMTTAMNVAAAVAGCMIILPSFQTEMVLKMIKKHRPALFPGVPTMYLALNNFPKVRQYGISSVKSCISGAAPLPVEVQEAFEKLTRGRLVEGYGLTEAGPVTHANPLNGLRKVGTIGIPVPGTEARIVSLTDAAHELPAGQIGELAVRGPQVMRGYWNNDAETAKVLTEDGWLLTGDVARMDEDGYFQIISRKKDMILAGKYQVYPRDVEEVLYEHPGVRDVAVVGLLNANHDDQHVKAYIVPQKGSKLAKEDLIAYCKRRLEEYAVPWEIEFRDELPKNFVGKVLRRLLVEEVVEQNVGGNGTTAPENGVKNNTPSIN